MKKSTKFLIMVLMLLTMLVAGCSGRNNAIGSVEMEKVAEKSEFFKAKQAEMQQRVTDAQTYLQEASKTAESQEAFNKIQAAKGAELRAYQERSQKEFKQSVETALSDIAKEKKLGAVLVKEAVAQGGVDVTEEVIAKLDAQLKKENAEKAAQAAKESATKDASKDAAKDPKATEKK